MITESDNNNGAISRSGESVSVGVGGSGVLSFPQIMQAHLKFALIAFLVLWLPLQSATALAMPMCVHMLTGGTGSEVTQAAGIDHAHGPANVQEQSGQEQSGQDHDAVSVHQHDAGAHGSHSHSGTGHHELAVADDSAATAPIAMAAVTTADSHDAGCNDCGLCQLACASVLLSTTKSFFIASPGAFVEMVPVSFLSITPSLLQRPPLAA